MKKRPHKTPVIGTCRRTGTEYHFDSVNATGPQGFNPDKVRNCAHGRAKVHAGFTWRLVHEGQRLKSHPRIEAAAKWFNEDKSYAQIAELMGVAPVTAQIYISSARQLGLVAKAPGR